MNNTGDVMSNIRSDVNFGFIFLSQLLTMMRVAVQGLALCCIILILFYHFELESPIVITWKDNGNGIPSPNIKATTEEEFRHLALSASISSPILFNIDQEYTFSYPSIPTQPEQIFIIPEHRVAAKSDSGRSISVTFPNSISQCSACEILFAVEDARDAVTLISKLFVDVACSDPRSESEELTIHKTLPVFPREDSLVAVMFPDESTGFGRFLARSTPDITLTGTLEKDYEVGELKMSRCWECESHFYRNIPLSYFFYVSHENGDIVQESSVLELNYQESMVLWVKPHPFIRERYPDIVDKCLFNAWMESDHVTQGASSMSHEYDARHGGYKIEIRGRDAVTFVLKVTLNWIFPFSEVRTDEPDPILTSSHIRHSMSYCDHARSEIFGSGRISIRVNGERQFIYPSTPVQCTDPMEEGRWLNVMDISADCRPPYCSGDRLNSLISHMSWQGRRYPWLWVPYSCHYHYYSNETLGECAKQSDIKWIHIMGDSLSREFMGYTMSIFKIKDVTKFASADLMLGDSGVRITFQSWADELFRGNERNFTFLDRALGQYNLLEAGTSKGLVDPKIKVNLELEETSPDVIIWNAANAYCLFQETEGTYRDWLEHFEKIAGDAFINGRKGDGKKAKVYWYGNPYFHGTAHEGTEHITQGRNKWFNAIARPIVERMGMLYYDSEHISHMRWEESWDGLHYLNGYEKWTGHVSATYIQVLYNHILQDCVLAV